MVAPGAGFRGVALCDVISVPFIKITICLKVGEDQKKRKKGLRRKLSGFLVQK